MIAQWTGRIVGDLHINELSQKDLADELGVTPRYVSMVLNGKKSPKEAEQRFTEALGRLKQKKSR